MGRWRINLLTYWSVQVPESSGPEDLVEHRLLINWSNYAILSNLMPSYLISFKKRLHHLTLFVDGKRSDQKRRSIVALVHNRIVRWDPFLPPSSIHFSRTRFFVHLETYFFSSSRIVARGVEFTHWLAYVLGLLMSEVSISISPLRVWFGCPTTSRQLISTFSARISTRLLGSRSTFVTFPDITSSRWLNGIYFIFPIAMNCVFQVKILWAQCYLFRISYSLAGMLGEVRNPPQLLGVFGIIYGSVSSIRPSPTKNHCGL